MAAPLAAQCDENGAFSLTGDEQANFDNPQFSIDNYSQYR
jgi:hypothetical protein